MDDKTLLNNIARSICDKKGFNIIALDVRDISTLTHYFIVAEGNVDRHVKAVSRNVIDNLKKIGNRPVNVEGLREGDWVVIDCWDVIVHIFSPGFRERYQLERVWSDGKIVELDVLQQNNQRGKLWKKDAL